MLQSQLARIRRYFLDSKFWSPGWKRVVPTGILLTCIGLLAYKVYASWETLLEYEWTIRYGWLVPSLLLFLAQTLAVVWGWRSLLNRLAPPVPFWTHVKIYCYTTLARRIPVGLLWQTAGRVYWYRQLGVPTSASAVASLLELGLVILAGLPIGALQVGTIVSLQPGYVLLASGLTMVVAAVLVQPKLLNRIRRAFNREELQASFSYQDSLRWMGIYVLVWLLSGAGLYVVVNLFFDLPLRVLPEIVGVWTLASLVSYLTLLAPSGFGVKELSLTFLLGFYLPEPLPLIVALATRVLWTAYEIIAGLASLAL